MASSVAVTWRTRAPSRWMRGHDNHIPCNLVDLSRVSSTRMMSTGQAGFSIASAEDPRCYGKGGVHFFALATCRTQPQLLVEGPRTGHITISLHVPGEVISFREQSSAVMISLRQRLTIVISTPPRILHIAHFPPQLLSPPVNVSEVETYHVLPLVVRNVLVAIHNSLSINVEVGQYVSHDLVPDAVLERFRALGEGARDLVKR